MWHPAGGILITPKSSKSSVKTGMKFMISAIRPMAGVVFIGLTNNVYTRCFGENEIVPDPILL